MIREEKAAKVEIHGLVKRFGDVLAVDNISVQIEPGEFITLLGPSGSGKTTTLMMVAGFEVPDDGDILLDDKPIMFEPAYKRGMGMVFQHYSLFPHMTIARNIGFPLKMRGVAKSDQRKKIADVLELVKLAGYEKRFPRQLSGGQQQRIALARALVFNPRVLLMDEPLGALDKKLREHMQLEIKQITESLKITVIYVTHDQDEAMAMSDRIAVMNEGQIEQIGSPAEIYDNPVNYFVADFIGESNFIKGKLGKTDGHVFHFISERGLTFKVYSNHDKPPAKAGHLLIRPEKILFADQAQSFSNQVEAVVKDIIYMGNITMYKVKLVEDDTELMIKQQNRFMNRPIDKGQSVTIGWTERDNCIV